MYDIVVIGGGPAGITAAIYGIRAGKKVLVLEANKVGGKIRKAHRVENYPGLYNVTGEEMADSFLKQAEDFNVEIKYEKAMNIMEKDDYKIVQTLDNMYETKTVILATGSDKRELGLPGEKELVGKGISYCATCDGNFFKKKNVAVAGGSEESVEDCLYLANICEKVYFIYNTKLDVSKLDKDNIEVLENTKITKIKGVNKLDGVVVKGKEEKEIKVDGLFIAIASVPETSYLLNGIDVNENGNVIASEDLTTKKKGVYVAGDIRVKSLRQVATAVADGAVAATEAIRYINSLKAKNKFTLSIHKKNNINDTVIVVNDSSIKYTSVTKNQGTEEEIVDERTFSNPEIIEEFMTKVYEKNRVILNKAFEKVESLKETTRVSNTAINDLIIDVDGDKKEFDCYIQEYENIPSLFTVEVEKFINKIK